MTSVANLERQPLSKRPADVASGAGEDRRGPLRPNQLIPTRARLQGRAVARAVQVADMAALLAVSVAANRLGGADPALASCAALATLVSLSLFTLR